MKKELLIFVLIVLCSCSPSNKQKIIGCWANSDQAYEFNSDGNVTHYYRTGSEKSQAYKFINENEILIGEEVYSIKFSEDDTVLILKDHIILNQSNNLTNIIEGWKKDNLMTEVTNVAAYAQQYYRKPVSMGGGGHSFLGFKIPFNLVKNSYSIESIEKDNIILIVKSVDEKYSLKCSITPTSVEEIKTK